MHNLRSLPSSSWAAQRQPVLKGKGALQDIDQMKLMLPHVKFAKAVRRVRDLGPVLERAFSIAQQGVPGPVFIECPIDLLYEESTIRGWYGQATPKGNSITAKVQRTYLNFHLKRQFAVGEDTLRQQPNLPMSSEHLTINSGKSSARLESAQSPLLVIGSQAMLRG